EELEIQPLRTAGRGVRPRSRLSTEAAADYTGEAQAAWEVEEDDGVAALDPQRQRIGVVPVNDPLLPSAELLDHGVPLLSRRALPPGAAVVTIQMDDGQTGNCGELARKGGLACPSGADDHDALPIVKLHLRSVGITFRVRRGA